MSAMMKFTLGRIGLFVAVLLILLPFPQISMLVKLLVAVLASFALSWFLLRGWRDEMAAEIADKVERRRAEKAKLRAALAGEDRSTGTAGSVDTAGSVGAGGDTGPAGGADGGPELDPRP